MLCPGNRYRFEGRGIKHDMGAAGVKVYDKFSRALRVETTANDRSFFQHHRKVAHKDGHTTRELAPLKKTIDSLLDLREILLGCNPRDLAFLSSLDNPSAGERDLRRLSQPRVDTDPRVKGLDFFDAASKHFYELCGWASSTFTAGAAPTCWHI